MSDIDEVLGRLDEEPSFREELQRDPQAALAGYDLTTDDLRVLAGQVTGDAGHRHAVEQRLGKSALFTLLARRPRHAGAADEIPPEA